MLGVVSGHRYVPTAWREEKTMTDRPFVRRIAALRTGFMIACAQGCRCLDNDVTLDDDFATGIGLFALIAFFVSVKGKKHLGFIILGVILVLA